MQPIEKRYTPAEAARYLELHPRTVLRYINYGFIDAELSPTGRYRIPHSSLKKYLDACAERAKERQLFLFN